MTIENYLAIIGGILALISGPIIVRERVSIFQLILDANRLFGGQVSRRTSETSSPRWVAICGIALTTMGVFAILGGLFARG